MANPGQRLFGTDANAYANGRPSYPSEIYDVLEGRCGLRAGTPTLEVGPGAGQATEDLIRRGADPVVAVEPDQALAAFLASRFPAADVHNVPLEEFEMPPGSVRLAASATAWHWVEQRVGLAKLARFVAPGGWCALWWTVYHDPTSTDDDLHAALQPILSPIPRVEAPSKQVPTAEFALEREERVAYLRGAFEDVAVDEFRWAIELTPKGARALFGTFSPILALDENRRAEVLCQIEEVVQADFGGRAKRSCVSILYTGQRSQHPRRAYG